MQTGTTPIPRSLGLKAGDYVRIRSIEEILSTLDDEGCLEGLPFMPEMLKYCGRRLRVNKVAHKTCDTVNGAGGRSMGNAVHLEDLRCDGSAHGGCEAGCTLFWKESWLQPDGDAAPPVRVADAGRTDEAGCSVETLHRSCQRSDSDRSEPTYRCQTTDLLKATELLGASEIGQYVKDVTSGNHSAWHVAKLLMRAGYEGIVGRAPGYRLWVWLFNAVQRLIGGKPWPEVNPTIPDGSSTPTAVLDLKPGERVRIRPIREIEQTITKKGFNRGMRFDIEMIKYCDGEYTVKSRVNKIINEKTGRMMNMKYPCILLEDVYCRAVCTPGRRGCPRAVNTYWREIWLERV